MSFPERRMRRLRTTAALRRLVADTALVPADLVAPLFVREGITEPNLISSMPGVRQHTVESLRSEVRSLIDLGVSGIMLFGIPETKDVTGSQAYNPDGITQMALRELREAFDDDIVLMADLCVDEFTDHGHCGVLDDKGNVDNDQTLELYSRVALAQANAGAHVVAPSGMMDGQVGAIRRALDEGRFGETAILSYSVKYASAFYGPFRDAVDVQIAQSGRQRYQQDWHNGRDALQEVRLDVAEGADMVMVKPAMAYLDVISAVRSEVSLPLAAYQVSGEYAMIKAAAANGWIDGDAAALESLTAIKRAGADFILSYFAAEIAGQL